MSVIIKESGWYRKTDDYGYEYVGEDTQELAEALDDSEDLDFVLKEWVNDNYCLEDIIQEILDGGARYTCKEDIINEWIQNVDVEEETIYLWHGEVTYFEEGDEAEMADYIIDSDGERIECVEDEDEEDEEEED